MQNYQTGFAEVNGAKIYYETAGDANDEVVVFLHAGVADRRMWDSQFNVFAKKYRVVRYDHRSFGNTQGEGGEYDAVQDLVGLLTHLDLESAALVGCSLGGIGAIDFTLTYPEKVWALVVSGSGLGGYQGQSSAAQEAFRDEFRAAFGAGDYSKAADMAMQMWLDGPGRPVGAVGDPIRGQVREMLLNAYQCNALISFKKLEPPAAQRLSEIQVPTLVLIGDADTSTILAIGDLLTSSIPHAKRIVYPNVAHMLNMEIPEQFNADVLAFLGQAGLS